MGRGEYSIVYGRVVSEKQFFFVVWKALTQHSFCPFFLYYLKWFTFVGLRRGNRYTNFVF